MTETDYRLKVLALEEKIEWNTRIKCKRVAAKYSRMLAELKAEHEAERGNTETEEEQEQSLLDGDFCDETTE